MASIINKAIFCFVLIDVVSIIVKAMLYCIARCGQFNCQGHIVLYCYMVSIIVKAILFCIDRCGQYNCQGHIVL